MKTLPKVGLAVAAGALAIGGIAGASLAQADPTPSPTPSGTATGGTGTTEDKPGRHGENRGDRNDRLATALAEKLGLDEAKVADAVEAAHTAAEAADDDTTGSDDRAAEQAAFVTALAKELGVTEEAVTKAMDEIRADADATKKADLASRLDQAVTDGTLTRAEADAVLKAAEAGVIGYGGRRR